MRTSERSSKGPSVRGAPPVLQPEGAGREKEARHEGREVKVETPTALPQLDIKSVGLQAKSWEGEVWDTKIGRRLAIFRYAYIAR